MKLHVIAFPLLMSLNLFAVSTDNLTEEGQQVFIETYSQLAVDEMLNHGIPSCITLAQAILESSWGQGATALNANNYFGIKCYNGWQGSTYYAMDDEPDKSCFRKYDDIVASFHDHSVFLRDGMRYQSLFQNSITDYQAWAEGLKNCGYATDPLYAQKLIDIIERFGLFVYDYAMPLDRVEVVDTSEKIISNQLSSITVENSASSGKRTIGSAILKAPTYQLSQLPGEGFFDQPVAPAEQQPQPVAVKQEDGPRIIVEEPVFEKVWD